MRLVAVSFARQLPQRQRAVGVHFGRPGVADMGVVRPHHDSGGLAIVVATQMGQHGVQASAMCWSRRFQVLIRPVNLAR